MWNKKAKKLYIKWSSVFGPNDKQHVSGLMNGQMANSPKRDLSKKSKGSF